MNAKNKVTFIISLISFQVFYLLANYTTKYLNFFFLLTFLIAVVVCYCLYRLIMQLFVETKKTAEFELLKEQQALNTEHLKLMQQQKEFSLKSYTAFSKNLQAINAALNEHDPDRAKQLTDSFLSDFQHTRLHPCCEDNLILAILESKRLLQNSPISRLITRFFFLKIP